MDIEDEYLYLCTADVPIMDTYIQPSYFISLVLTGTTTVCRITTEEIFVLLRHYFLYARNVSYHSAIEHWLGGTILLGDYMTPHSN